MAEHRILVVDDERWIRVNLKRILEADGYQVVLADGGEAALNLLEQQRAALVISDHRMPRMSGLEFLEQVKERYPSILRVMLTGFADLQLALDAINRVEIHRLLLKPYSRDQIVSAVRELIELKEAGSEIAPVDLNQARIRKSTLETLQQEHPGIAEVSRDRMGRIVISDSDIEDVLGDDWADLKDLVEKDPDSQ